jgi:hypothetical protein
MSGVAGVNTGKGYGTTGTTNGDYVLGSGISAGVWGSSSGGAAGVMGTSESGDGVVGYSNSSQHAGVSGNNSAGGWAGLFVGNVQVTGDVVLTGGDCAEEFDVESAVEIEAGTVMVIAEGGGLAPSATAYDRKAAGVISGAGDYRPGLILDRKTSSEGRLPIGLVGKVCCKVDADHGAIEIGDLLTTSPTPGHAMKASDRSRAFGAIIGKALQPIDSGQGLILVLVALQ